MRGRSIPASIYQEIFELRGISRTVAEARPYVPFERGDLRAIYEADPRLSRHPLWARNIVNQTGGLVMIRHSVVPGLDQPLPEIRPNNPYRPIVSSKEPIKYGLPPGRTAKRFDIHPLCSLDVPGPIYVALEGCLKADAILSAGNAVISVPSVTCWRGTDLDEVAQLLLNREKELGEVTFVVTDSDWYAKWQVMLQAKKICAFLTQRGVTALPVAPPQVASTDKVGVDDWLGECGGSLDELVDIDIRMTLEPDELRVLLVQRSKERGYKVRGDAVDTDLRVLGWMQGRSSGNGAVGGFVRHIARQLFLAPSTVCRSIHRLEERHEVLRRVKKQSGASPLGDPGEPAEWRIVSTPAENWTPLAG